MSRGFDLYRRVTDASDLAVGPLEDRSARRRTGFGYPVAEQVSIDFGANLESVDLEIFSNSPFFVPGNFVREFGSQYTYVSGTAGWTRDARDSLILTTA